MTHSDHIRELFRGSRPFFIALGDPVRQELLMSMVDGESLSVKELTARTNLSRPTVSHHLRILKEANIVVEQVRGRQTFYKPQTGEYFETVKKLIQTIDIAIQQKELEK